MLLLSSPYVIMYGREVEDESSGLFFRYLRECASQS